MRLPLYVFVFLLSGAASAETLLRFPADDPTGKFFMEQPIIHVDHDPKVASLAVDCFNYAGLSFPWCYDEHHGTDFLLKGGFGAMDQHDVAVVAAADGTVVKAVDGNYDRCHGKSGLEVTCDGNPMIANQVTLRHADGLNTLYYHLKKGSVKVKVGDAVRCGQLLGYVGSSGKSAMPHLHFGLTGSDGKWIDPFAGIKSQLKSYWVQQKGQYVRPAARCQGEPAPTEAGPEAGADGAVGGDAAVGASGCRLAGEAGGAWPLSGIVLCVVLAARRRRHKKINNSDHLK